MEMEPRLKVSANRLVKSGIEPATLGLQGKCLIHYTTAALLLDLSHVYLNRCEFLLLRLDINKTNKFYLLINNGHVPDMVK